MLVGGHLFNRQFICHCDFNQMQYGLFQRYFTIKDIKPSIIHIYSRIIKNIRNQNDNKFIHMSLCLKKCESISFYKNGMTNSCYWCPGFSILLIYGYVFCGIVLGKYTINLVMSPLSCQFQPQLIELRHFLDRSNSFPSCFWSVTII